MTSIRRILLAGAASLVVMPAIAQDSEQLDDDTLRDMALTFFEPIPKEPQPLRSSEVRPEEEELTAEKIELGKMLYFDPRMSSSQLISCQTCHQLGLGGTDDQVVSIGHGWQTGPRNAPTVFNAVFNIAQFWDGRAPDLAEQAKGPIEAGVEMHNTPERVVQTLESMPGYVEAFDAAFPGVDQPITFDNFAFAIEQFEATLITPNAPLDLFMEGDNDAMSDQEKRGLQAFVEIGCVSCHQGINIGGQDYFAFGVVENPGADVLPPDDPGRFNVTQTASDEYVFRASPLRNIALTAPYFHSGGVWDLQQAVKIMSSSQLGTEMTEEQAQDIVAFLHTLTGERPEVTLPILPERTAETPLPQPMLPMN